MTLSKDGKNFWIQSAASDLQNCAYNLAQDSIGDATMFMNHAQKILVKVKKNNTTIAINNANMHCNTKVERIKLADKLCTLADLLLLQTI